MRRFIIAILLLIGFTNAAHGQSKPKPKRPSRDSIIDAYNGTIPFGKDIHHLELELKHCLHCDMGSFSLTEGIQGSAKGNSTITGKWTVLKGDATDDNATVVELDGPGNPFYFLRLKSGSLQQLDAHLHELKPAGKYILRKQ